MKKTTLTLFAVLLLCAGFGASQIRWTWHGVKIYQAQDGDANKLQFGLRDDGVVVWREIANTTNSPAEQTPIIWGFTNYGTFILDCGKATNQAIFGLP